MAPLEAIVSRLWATRASSPAWERGRGGVAALSGESKGRRCGGVTVDRACSDKARG